MLQLLSFPQCSSKRWGEEGDPDLRQDVLQHSSSIHRRRPDVAAPLLSMVLSFDGGKSGGSGLRPDVLQHSPSVHRRRPDVAAPLLPAVLTVDAVEKSADLTFDQMFFSIPPPSIAVGPVAAPLFPGVLALDGVEKSGGPDLRPDVLQHSCVHRRRPDVAAPLLPAVLTVDVVRRAVDLSPVHSSRLVTPSAPSVKHAQSMYSPVQKMFFFLPHLDLMWGAHLHLRWGPLSKASICILTLTYLIHVYCFGPAMDSTLSYHRPTIPPHLSLKLQIVLPVHSRGAIRGHTTA